MIYSKKNILIIPKFIQKAPLTANVTSKITDTFKLTSDLPSQDNVVKRKRGRPPKKLSDQILNTAHNTSCSSNTTVTPLEKNVSKGASTPMKLCTPNTAQNTYCNSNTPATPLFLKKYVSKDAPKRGSSKCKYILLGDEKEAVTNNVISDDMLLPVDESLTSDIPPKHLFHEMKFEEDSIESIRSDISSNKKLDGKECDADLNESLPCDITLDESFHGPDSHVDLDVSFKSDDSDKSFNIEEVLVSCEDSLASDMSAEESFLEKAETCKLESNDKGKKLSKLNSAEDSQIKTKKLSTNSCNISKKKSKGQKSIKSNLSQKSKSIIIKSTSAVFNISDTGIIEQSPSNVRCTNISSCQSENPKSVRPQSTRRLSVDRKLSISSDASPFSSVPKTPKLTAKRSKYCSSKTPKLSEIHKVHDDSELPKTPTIKKKKIFKCLVASDTTMSQDESQPSDSEPLPISVDMVDISIPSGFKNKLPSLLIPKNFSIVKLEKLNYEEAMATNELSNFVKTSKSTKSDSVQKSNATKSPKNSKLDGVQKSNPAKTPKNSKLDVQKSNPTKTPKNSKSDGAQKSNPAKTPKNSKSDGVQKSFIVKTPKNSKSLAVQKSNPANTPKNSKPADVQKPNSKTPNRSKSESVQKPILAKTPKNSKSDGVQKPNLAKTPKNSISDGVSNEENVKNNHTDNKSSKKCVTKSVKRKRVKKSSDIPAQCKKTSNVNCPPNDVIISMPSMEDLSAEQCHNGHSSSKKTPTRKIPKFNFKTNSAIKRLTSKLPLNPSTSENEDNQESESK